MSELPTPTAARLPRARWLDTRMLLGVLLVLGSVAVGAKVIAQADDSVAVWALTRDLGPRSTLTADDLSAVHVRLSAADRYLSAAADPPTGFVLTRPVGARELVPRDALAAPDSLDLRRLVVEVAATTAAGLARGRTVDVYVVPRREGSDAPAAPPRLVVPGITVDGVDDGGPGFGGGTTRGVALVVTRDQITDLLDAASSGTIHLVQVPRG